MILYNDAATVTDLETDNHFIPTLHVQNAAGLSAIAFLTG